MPRPHITALLIDLSGTLHIGSTPTPRAISALAKLRESQIPFRFCTNTSKESTEELGARLKGIGFDVRGEEEGEVWSSLGAVKRVLASRGVRKPYFLLTESARQECASAIPSYDEALQDESVPYDSVVVGLAPEHFHYDAMNTAFRTLVGEGDVPFIATHKAKYIRAPDGELSLGPGPFVAALEHAAGVAAEVVGKPSRRFFETVIGSMKISESGRVAVVGDDVEADLGEGAVELGLWRVLGECSRSLYTRSG
ncbi:HAD-like protein [Heliocybe sulcata]|uniref:HAD-like protein n=1 Tax=Heliocybe sulcata TaxID=5364 RepID=A0A5C3N852_9AGAM|nr:HAD-like protein [Heliocybe sulcata]